MRKFPGMAAFLAALWLAGCSNEPTDVVKDEAVLAGVSADKLKGADLIEAEELPGRSVQGADALGQFVQNNAWGHHASCTCAIGRADTVKAVLGTNFRVRGTTGLRVVDASVFPKIPGFFIVTSVYMIGEKAAEVISADAKKTAP